MTPKKLEERRWWISFTVPICQGILVAISGGPRWAVAMTLLLSYGAFRLASHVMGKIEAIQRHLGMVTDSDEA